MKDIIASQIQTRRSSGSPRLGLTFGLAVLLPALVLSMVFTTSAQPTEDLKITVNFTPDRPVTPDTNIELRLSRALKEGEGRIAVIINHSDITSLFVIDGTRLVYSPTLVPLPLGATQVVVHLAGADGAWREVARFDLQVVKEKPAPTPTPSPVPQDLAKPNISEANARADGNSGAIT